MWSFCKQNVRTCWPFLVLLLAYIQWSYMKWIKYLLKKEINFHTIFYCKVCIYKHTHHLILVSILHWYFVLYMFSFVKYRYCGIIKITVESLKFAGADFHGLLKFYKVVGTYVILCIILYLQKVIWLYNLIYIKDVNSW